MELPELAAKPTARKAAAKAPAPTSADFEIHQALRWLADLNAAGKPEFQIGPNQIVSLKKLWQIPDDELRQISVPLQEVIPAMPEKVRTILGKAAPFVALIVGIQTVVITRLQQEREILNELRRIQSEHTVSPRAHGGNGAEPGNADTSGLRSSLSELGLSPN